MSFSEKVPCVFLCSLVLFHLLTTAGTAGPSFTKPIYNIAHMVNSIKEISIYLSRGANAIEADVSFAPNGTATTTFHGYPCDCFRHCTQTEDIDTYLSYVREITEPENPGFKKQFALLFLDLKVSSLPPEVKTQAGSSLARKVIAHLFEYGNTNSRIKLLLSIGYTYDYDFVLGFQSELEILEMEHLNRRIGWDVGMNDEVEDVIDMWESIDIVDNIWLGDGYTNCISPFYNSDRLTHAIAQRDLKRGIDKVYHWTIDFHHSLRASLNFGVDGIITNHPERLKSVLKESAFKFKFRLATQDDDPWERFDPGADKGPTIDPSPQGSAHAVATAADVFTSFTKFLRDFVILRLTA